MSLAVRQLTKYLTDTYKSRVDMSDLAEAHRDDAHFLSRALAAFYIESNTALSPDDAARHITDSYEDNGIDAVFVDSTNKRLHLIQTKFIAAGTGGPDQGDTAKFCNGVRLLINATFDTFSSRFKPLQPSIEAALDDPHGSIVVSLVTTGDSFSDHVKRELDRLRTEINNPIELVQIHTHGISDVHGWLRDAAATKEVEFELMLREWGTTQEPLVSYYGQVSCIELSEIHQKYRHHLFSTNIRKFLGDTKINEAITQTALVNPEQFLFHSNGVVILAESVSKTAKGGSNRDAGTFVCSGAQVVNGAQTIGALAAAAEKDRDAVSRARLFARIIEVPKSETALATLLTKSTNTQNRVDRKDFVTLDPRHEQFRIDLSMDGIEYIFKSGDKSTQPNNFTFEEAVSALACFHGNLQYAIDAKKEIGKLWEQTDAAPYTDLFTSTLSADRLWRVVQMARAIDARLSPRSRPAGEERNLAIHGSKIAQHIVFRKMNQAIKNDSKKAFVDEIESKTDKVFEAMKETRKTVLSDGYLARMFYNTAKTKSFVDDVLGRIA